MRKIAFFVEGTSEMLFLERLIEEVANAKEILIEKMRIRGGGKSGKHPKTISIVDGKVALGSEQFYVMIVDCGGDHLVGQRIREEHKRLTDDGYERIIGVRDIRPSFTREEAPLLLQGMEGVVDKALAPVIFVLSMMEVEAWFLAEYSHYERIHPELTPQVILESLGFDPRILIPGERDYPSSDLQQSYALRGIVYEKSSVQNTIDSLDMAYVYTELPEKVPEIAVLAQAVDDFLVVK
jgi:hypothetical protein